MVYLFVERGLYMIDKKVFVKAIDDLTSQSLLDTVTQRLNEYNHDFTINGVLDFTTYTLDTDQSSFVISDNYHKAFDHLRTRLELTLKRPVFRLPVTDGLRDYLENIDVDEFDGTVEVGDTKVITVDSDRSLSREDLRRSFENQMVLLVQLDDYFGEKHEAIKRINHEGYSFDVLDTAEAISKDLNQLQASSRSAVLQGQVSL